MMIKMTTMMMLMVAVVRMIHFQMRARDGFLIFFFDFCLF